MKLPGGTDQCQEEIQFRRQMLHDLMNSDLSIEALAPIAILSPDEIRKRREVFNLHFSAEWKATRVKDAMRGERMEILTWEMFVMDMNAIDMEVITAEALKSHMEQVWCHGVRLKYIRNVILLLISNLLHLLFCCVSQNKNSSIQVWNNIPNNYLIYSLLVISKSALYQQIMLKMY